MQILFQIMMIFFDGGIVIVFANGVVIAVTNPVPNDDIIAIANVTSL